MLKSQIVKQTPKQSSNYYFQHVAVLSTGRRAILRTRYSILTNNQDGAQLNKLSLKIQFKMLKLTKYDKIN